MSTQEVRDLVWVGEAESQRLLKRAQDTLAQWKAHWFPASADWVTDLQKTDTNDGVLQASASDWHAHIAADGEGWHQQSEDAATRVAQLLVQRKGGARLSSDDWACQAAELALDDLHTRMLGPLSKQTGHAPRCAPHSGTLCLSLTALGCSWAWQVASAQPGQAPATLTPLARCLPPGQLKVNASLGTVDILMSDLISLQEGDVVPFPTSTDGTISVHLSTDASQGDHAFTARIGRQHGQWAIQASALASSNVKN
jgi:flagellar motor switch/type III secretory pathway protein FliN